MRGLTDHSTSKNGVQKVEALNMEELKVEIERERKTLTWHVFFCCCLCALMGLKNTTKAFQLIDSGKDTEARNELLDAKINKSNSCCWGAVIWTTFLEHFISSHGYSLGYPFLFLNVVRNK